MPTKTFETPGTVDLRLRVPTGDMRVTAVADNQTVVDYDGEDAEQRVTVSHHAHGDRHEVIVEVDSRRRGFGHGFRWGNNDDVNVRVRVPVDSDVRVLTASGDLVIDGEVAVVDVKTASGDVRVESMTSGRVVSASGDVTVGVVGGDASLNTVSGDVEIGTLDGDVNLRSVSGDIDVACAVGGEVAVRTVSGDVEVAVRRGSLVHIDAQALSGDLSSELDLDGDPDGVETEEPLVDLRVVTVSGDVRLRRSTRQEVST